MVFIAKLKLLYLNSNIIFIIIISTPASPWRIICFLWIIVFGSLISWLFCGWGSSIAGTWKRDLKKRNNSRQNITRWCIWQKTFLPVQQLLCWDMNTLRVTHGYWNFSESLFSLYIISSFDMFFPTCIHSM